MRFYLWRLVGISTKQDGRLGLNLPPLLSDFDGTPVLIRQVVVDCAIMPGHAVVERRALALEDGTAFKRTECSFNRFAIRCLLVRSVKALGEIELDLLTFARPHLTMASDLKGYIGRFQLIVEEGEIIDEVEYPVSRAAFGRFLRRLGKPRVVRLPMSCVQCSVRVISSRLAILIHLPDYFSMRVSV